MAYGYEPINYVPDYSWMSKVGLQVSEVVKQIPGLVEETRNLYRNRDALPKLQEGYLNTVMEAEKKSPGLIQQYTGLDPEAFKSATDPKPFEKKDPSEYLKHLHDVGGVLLGAIGAQTLEDRKTKEKLGAAADLAKKADTSLTAEEEKKALDASTQANREAGNIPFSPIEDKTMGPQRSTGPIGNTGYVAPEPVAPQTATKEYIEKMGVQNQQPSDVIGQATLGRPSEEKMAAQKAQADKQKALEDYRNKIVAISEKRSSLGTSLDDLRAAELQLKRDIFTKDTFNALDSSIRKSADDYDTKLAAATADLESAKILASRDEDGKLTPEAQKVLMDEQTKIDDLKKEKEATLANIIAQKEIVRKRLIGGKESSITKKKKKSKVTPINTPAGLGTPESSTGLGNLDTSGLIKEQAKKAPSLPTGNEASPKIPRFSSPTDPAFLALPSGAVFIDANGVRRRKK